MTSTLQLEGSRRSRAVAGFSRFVGSTAVGTVVAGATAYLIVTDRLSAAVALIALLPVFVLVHRAPLAVVGLWLFVVPLVVNLQGDARYLFWLFHRALPLLAVVVLVLTGMLNMRPRLLAKLGFPELMMLGYVLVTLVSIAYTSDDVALSMTDLYDRVVIPMCLYLLVRLLRPGAEKFNLLLLAAAFIVLTQTLIGGLSWAAEGVLPDGWLGRAGSRTTGSFGSPSVYGVTLIAAGLILIHGAVQTRRLELSRILRALFILAMAMAVLSFTRAVWLAVLIAVLSMARLHPRQFGRVLIVVLPVLAILVVSGVVAKQAQLLEERLESEDTALSRLPVISASVDMFEAKPITGWGYGNFDKFDRDFQRETAGFFPEKDQASHNVYLTVLAEQGAPGLLLLFGPAVWWLWMSKLAYRDLPRTGIMSRKLLILLWTMLAAHFVVNNFSNMKIPAGLGQWWLILGLIASMVTVEESEPEGASRMLAEVGR